MRHRFQLVTLVCTAAAVLVGGAPATAIARDTETMYVDGHTVQVNTGAGVVFDASPGLLAQSSPIFIIGFPVAPDTTGPITLPSGYEPQHNGFPPSPIPYHDHVLPSEQGVLRQVVELRYSSAYAYSPGFVPITSADQIPAAEAAGKLEIINPGATDPYKLPMTTVLIRPVIRAR